MTAKVSGPFTGPPLVAGTVQGFRHFNVSTEGFLYGPATGVPFMPGENIAHHLTIGTALMLSSGPSVMVSSLLDVAMPSDHRVAERDCRCGYYAYYHEEYSEYGGLWRVPAVIEGYGLVTLGTRGFRAEKARLVAVALPEAIRGVSDHAELVFKARQYGVLIYDNEMEMLHSHPLSEPERVEPKEKVLPPPPAPSPTWRPFTWWRRKKHG